MAWTYVGGSGGSLNNTTTTHTLNEPAGATSGDLLIACIVSRIASATPVTLPSGWTLAGQRNANNILTTSSAVPTATMAYIVRGGSAPSYVFTHPVIPAPALGRVFAYRGGLATPFDVATSFITAINITAVSGAGLTTTVAGDLIVVMCAGGQEGTWSGFNATDPGTASGATNTTTAPTAGTWLERSDVMSVTDNDCSYAVFDAIRSAAGATGNLTATTTIAAGNAVIAAAFKVGASTPGRAKVWSGSTWAEKPVKVWSGSAWVEKPVKFWNGSAWVAA